MRFLRPSSGAQNCIYSIGYFVKPLLLPSTVVAGSSKCLTKYPMLYIHFWAPDDGRRNRLKHVEHFTEMNKLCNAASCWLYLEIRLRCTDPWSSNLCRLFINTRETSDFVQDGSTFPKQATIITSRKALLHGSYKQMGLIGVVDNVLADSAGRGSLLCRGRGWGFRILKSGLGSLRPFPFSWQKAEFWFPVVRSESNFSDFGESSNGYWRYWMSILLLLAELSCYRNVWYQCCHRMKPGMCGTDVRPVVFQSRRWVRK